MRNKVNCIKYCGTEEVVKYVLLQVAKHLKVYSIGHIIVSLNTSLMFYVVQFCLGDFGEFFTLIFGEVYIY